MWKTLLVPFLLLSFTLFSYAQKDFKPTLTPKPETENQKKLINEGVKLHDQGLFDEAIKKYQQVLQENPDSDLARYEITLSYYNKKDFSKALDSAFQLIKYKSNTGILGYGIIANILDDQGKPQEAVKIYQDAIKQLEKDPQYKSHISSLYYNLGVTYVRQKQYKESREALKKSVNNDFNYPSPNYLLAEVFYGTKYKVPALLAASRLLSLEFNSQRSKRATAMILDILKPAKKDEKTGNINIFLDINTPEDEGKFGGLELILGTLTIVKDEKDKNKSENELFADSVDTVIAILSESKDLKSTFVGKTYIPYMAEMKQKNYSKIFAYIVLQQSGNQDAEKWLSNNEAKVKEFLAWTTEYKLPN